MQHIESAQHYTEGPFVTLTDGPLYVSQKKAHQYLFEIGQTTYQKLKNILMTDAYIKKLSLIKTY